MPYSILFSLPLGTQQHQLFLALMITSAMLSVSKKITSLCLLDLSTAFVTIDHCILIEHITSWFGLNGTVLSWIQSYLISGSFKVIRNGTESPIYQLVHGVRPGSVLGPLLFMMYFYRYFESPLSWHYSPIILCHHTHFIV